MESTTEVVNDPVVFLGFRENGENVNYVQTVAYNNYSFLITAIELCNKHDPTFSWQLLKTQMTTIEHVSSLLSSHTNIILSISYAEQPFSARSE